MKGDHYMLSAANAYPKRLVDAPSFLALATPKPDPVDNVLFASSPDQHIGGVTLQCNPVTLYPPIAGPIQDLWDQLSATIALGVRNSYPKREMAFPEAMVFLEFLPVAERTNLLERVVFKAETRFHEQSKLYLEVAPGGKGADTGLVTG